MAPNEEFDRHPEEPDASTVGPVKRFANSAKAAWVDLKDWLKRLFPPTPSRSPSRRGEPKMGANADPAADGSTGKGAGRDSGDMPSGAAVDAGEPSPPVEKPQAKPDLDRPSAQESVDFLNALSESGVEPTFIPGGDGETAPSLSRGQRMSERARSIAPSEDTAAEQEMVDAIMDEIGLEIPGGRGGMNAEPVELRVHIHEPNGRTRSPARGGRRAAEKGQSITRIDRYAVDGLVFDRKKPGGTVLIDNSGSMALDPDAIAEAIQRFPALTVAMYSGSWGSGRLCVLAYNGALGDLETCGSMRGNEVDIEALAWLARQSEPRVWVSDGFVCGGLVDALGGDSGMANDLIRGMCARKKIARSESFEGAVRILERGTVRGVGYQARDASFLPVWDR